MSKNLICSESELNDIYQKILNLVKNKKIQNGKINIEYNLPDLPNKAVVKFSMLAWIKIVSLVSAFDKEVQWHGLVQQINDNTWKVNDILVFPHEATNVTVTSRQEDYEKWLNSLDNQTFNQLRFHGHSHGDMGVSPSGVDMEYRAKMIQNISPRDDSPYYIFMIINKKNEITIEIYDIEKNIVYTNLKDIDIVVEAENDTIANFINNARKMVTSPTTIQHFNNNYKHNKKKNKITTNDEKPIMRDFYEDGNYYCSHCRDFDCKNCKYY